MLTAKSAPANRRRSASRRPALRPAPRSVRPPPPTPSPPVVAPSFAFVLLLPLAAAGLLAGASTGCYVYPADVRDPCVGKECSFGARCVPSVDGLVARCQCLQSCSSYGDAVDSWPVCSTDGTDYASVCEMRKASCRLMTDIEKKYDGKCGTRSQSPCIQCNHHRPRNAIGRVRLSVSTPSFEPAGL